jgi:hypothetical protein
MRLFHTNRAEPNWWIIQAMHYGISKAIVGLHHLGVLAD